MMLRFSDSPEPMPEGKLPPGYERKIMHAEFRVGDRIIATAPTEALTWMLFLDAVHHRGQLSTYIRPMGGKVPSIYGPSADTQS